MDTNEAKTVADFLIADLEGEMPTTLRVLEAVPNATISTTGRTLSPRAASGSCGTSLSKTSGCSQLHRQRRLYAAAGPF